MLGVFDSGIGGLTVVKAIWSKWPDLPIVYFGDTARLPYGNKSPKTIQHFAGQAVKFLQKQKVTTIVIACNTASALAYDQLKQNNDLPLINVIDPAVATAVATTKNKRIGLIGTRSTVKSEAYEQKLKAQDAKIQVKSIACPLLVPLAEENWLKKPETKRILRYYLRPLKNENIDTLILGCTHYPLFRSQIEHIMGRKVKVIDSGDGVVSELAKIMPKSSSGKSKFYLSDKTDQFQDMAERFLGKKIGEIEEVDIEKY